MIEIYSDGSSLGNPGKSGWAYIIKQNGAIVSTASEGFELSTNNRMELMGLVRGLQSIKNPSEVVTYCDSQYVTNAYNKNWIDGWIKRGWKNVKNKDLWLEMIKEQKRHTIKFEWIKGHAGHTENELCDKMAKAAAKLPFNELKKDHEYLAVS
jgi:ribonuclease HI